MYDVPKEYTAAIRAPTRSDRMAGKLILTDGSKISYDVEAIQTNDNQTKSGVIDLWMDSLVNNREPEISGRSALTAMRAVFASLRSSELGTAVEIPENR